MSNYGKNKYFVIFRDEDVTGVSGTGLVACGYEKPDGSAIVHWEGKWPTKTVHHRGMASVEAIHGHGGKTRIVLCPMAKSGVPKVPLGAGWAVWVEDEHPLKQGGAWLYGDRRDTEPLWNAVHYDETGPATLVNGDHIWAWDCGGKQVKVTDCEGLWLSMITYQPSATGVYVTRLVGSTGGDPAAVRVQMTQSAAEYQRLRSNLGLSQTA